MIRSNSVPNFSQSAPLNTSDIPSPIFTRQQEHSFPQLLRQFIEEHLDAHEHIPVLAVDGNKIFLVVETKQRDPEVISQLYQKVAQQFPGYSIESRCITFSSLSSPDERALYRKLYLAYPQVSGIDVINKVVTTTAHFSTDAANQDLLTSLHALTGKSFSLTLSDEVAENEPLSYIRQSNELLKISELLWNEHSFNKPFNSFSVDLGQSRVEIYSEYEDRSSKTHLRLLKRIEEQLHPFTLSIVGDFSLRELGVFLHDLVPTQTLGYKVAQEGRSISINLLLESELQGQSETISALISEELSKHYRHEVRVSVTTSSSELAQEIFFDTKEQDSPLDEAQIRQKIFGIMPTRHDLRRVQFYPDKSLTELTLTSPPPAEVIHQIESLTGGAVSIKIIKLPVPNETVENPVRWLKQYGEPLPYFEEKQEENVTLLGHGGFLKVGGSSMLLNFFGRKILLDNGGYLTTNKRTPLPKETIREAEVAIISHAHFDHTGDLLDAALQGLSIPILTTHSTAIAMYAVLEEQARIKGLPPSIVEEVYKNVRIVPFNEPIRLADNLTVTFYPAGHLVGAALTRFEFEKDNGEVVSLLYTGDFKYGESRLHEKATLPPPSDIVIAEGTYGTKEAPNRKIVEKDFFAQIQDTVRRRGTTLLPVLSLNRAQEVLSILDDNRPWFSKYRVPIHVVGSVIEKNQIYSYLSEVNPQDFKSSALATKPWRFNHHTAVSMPKKGWFSQALIEPTSPKVIVASGGMLIGQAEKLLKFFSESEKNLLLLTCYQAETTLGREVLNYAEGIGPKPQGYKKFRMRVSRSQLSGHSSGKETIAFLEKIVKPSGTIVLVHGDKNALMELETELRSRGISKNIMLPKPRLVYDLMAPSGTPSQV